MQTERKSTKEVIWQEPGNERASIRSGESAFARHSTAWHQSKTSVATSAIISVGSVDTGILSSDDAWADAALQSMFAAPVSPEGSMIRLTGDEYTHLTKSTLYEQRTKEVEEWKEEYRKAWREKKLTEYKAQKQAQETDKGIEAILYQRLRLEKEAKKEREFRRMEEGLTYEDEKHEDEMREDETFLGKKVEDELLSDDQKSIQSKLTERRRSLQSTASSEEIFKETELEINKDLSRWYITRAEMNQLNFDEELLVVDENHVTRGTWRVQIELSAQELFHVVFEGITREETKECHAMNHTGWVSRNLLPERDFRVEQFSTSSPAQTTEQDGQGEEHDRRHSTKSVPRTSAEVRRDSTFRETRQPGVTKQSKMLYTQRVEGNYWVQSIRRTDDQGQDNNCKRIIDPNAMRSCLTDAAFLILLRKMARSGFKGKIKAKTIVMTGDICPITVYSHQSRPVKLNGIELEVKRIKRKLITPRDKESISNFFLTSLGQLVAVRHNDDRFGLQIDLNSVLSNEKIVPPERSVPLRNRYLYDPELSDYFLNQVEEMSYLNELYLHDHPEVMEMLTNLLNGLLIDKPHRVVAYAQNYFLRTV